MDPVIAMGIAGNVITFLHFASGLVSKGHKIYKSADGVLLENAQLDAVARNLVSLNNRIADSVQENHLVRGFSSTEQELKTVCEACNKAAESLIDTLEKLKAPGRHGKWRSLRQAFKSVWTKYDVDRMASQLDSYRRQLDTTILVALRYVTTS